MVYVVTLEPGKKLHEEIISIKNKVKSIVGDQLYLKHNPHLTLYVGNFDGLDNFSDELDAYAAGIKNNDVKITGWFVFKDDVITKKNTLVCELSDNSISNLKSVQQEVVDIMNKYRGKQLLKRYE